MRIHLWVRINDIDKFVKFLSTDFVYDEELQFMIWYDKPTSTLIKEEYVQISITPDQYAKLETWAI